MRSLYREKTYTSGDYLEVNIYPVFRAASGRGKKAKPTTEAQKKLNERNAARKLERLIDANFTRDDIKCELSYRPGCEPEDTESAVRDCVNFMRRLKRIRTRLGLCDLKYIYVTERGEKSGRYHHHVIISGGVSPRELAECWGLGYVQKIQPLQFGPEGCAGIAYYMNGNKRGQKAARETYRHFHASKNLVQPKERVRDGRISRRVADEMAKDCAGYCRERLEALYPGYIFAAAEQFYNDVNGGVYLTAKMYRDGCDFGERKRKTNKRKENENAY